MGCQPLDETLELYLLGVLAGGALKEVTEHLGRGCPSCSTGLREAALVVYLLCRSPRSVRPDPKLKSRLLRRLSRK